MPRRAPRPCTSPGCPALVRYPVQRCPQHERVRRRVHDERRPSAHQRGYDETWRKVRLIQLDLEPLCRFCSEKGRIVAASVVDHVLTIEERPDLRLNLDNLRSLCVPCHNARTAREQRR